VYSGNWLAFVSCSGYHPSKPTKPEIPEKRQTKESEARHFSSSVQDVIFTSSTLQTAVELNIH
jgi:hypothetical protein